MSSSEDLFGKYTALTLALVSLSRAELGSNITQCSQIGLKNDSVEDCVLIGLVLKGLDDAEGAEFMYRQAAEILSVDPYSEFDRNVAVFNYTASECESLLAWESSAWISSVEAVYTESKLGVGHLHVADCMLRSTASRFAAGDLHSALESWDIAIQTLEAEKEKPEVQERMHSAYVSGALLTMLVQDYSKVLEVTTSGIELATKLGKHKYLTSSMLFLLAGESLWKMGKASQALRPLTQAYEQFAQKNGKAHPQTVSARKKMNRVRRHLNMDIIEGPGMFKRESGSSGGASGQNATSTTSLSSAVDESADPTNGLDGVAKGSPEDSPDHASFAAAGQKSIVPGVEKRLGPDAHVDRDALSALKNIFFGDRDITKREGQKEQQKALATPPPEPEDMYTGLDSRMDVDGYDNANLDRPRSFFEVDSSQVAGLGDRGGGAYLNPDGTVTYPYSEEYYDPASLYGGAQGLSHPYSYVANPDGTAELYYTDEHGQYHQVPTGSESGVDMQYDANGHPFIYDAYQGAYVYVRPYDMQAPAAQNPVAQYSAAAAYSYASNAGTPHDATHASYFAATNSAYQVSAGYSLSGIDHLATTTRSRSTRRGYGGVGAGGRFSRSRYGSGAGGDDDEYEDMDADDYDSDADEYDSNDEYDSLDEGGGSGAGPSWQTKRKRRAGGGGNADPFDPMGGYGPQIGASSGGSANGRGSKGPFGATNGGSGGPNGGGSGPMNGGVASSPWSPFTSPLDSTPPGGGGRGPYTSPGPSSGMGRARVGSVGPMGDMDLGYGGSGGGAYGGHGGGNHLSIRSPVQTSFPSDLAALLTPLRSGGLNALSEDDLLTPAATLSWGGSSNYRSSGMQTPSNAFGATAGGGIRGDYDTSTNLREGTYPGQGLSGYSESLAYGRHGLSISTPPVDRFDSIPSPVARQLPNWGGDSPRVTMGATGIQRGGLAVAGSSKGVATPGGRSRMLLSDEYDEHELLGLGSHSSSRNAYGSHTYGSPHDNVATLPSMTQHTYSWEEFLPPHIRKVIHEERQQLVMQGYRDPLADVPGFTTESAARSFAHSLMQTREKSSTSPTAAPSSALQSQVDAVLLGMEERDFIAMKGVHRDQVRRMRESFFAQVTKLKDAPRNALPSSFVPSVPEFETPAQMATYLENLTARMASASSAVEYATQRNLPGQEAAKSALMTSLKQAFLTLQSDPSSDRFKNAPAEETVALTDVKKSLFRVTSEIYKKIAPLADVPADANSPYPSAPFSRTPFGATSSSAPMQSTDSLESLWTLAAAASIVGREIVTEGVQKGYIDRASLYSMDDDVIAELMDQQGGGAKNPASASGALLSSVAVNSRGLHAQIKDALNEIQPLYGSSMVAPAPSPDQRGDVQKRGAAPGESVGDMIAKRKAAQEQGSSLTEDQVKEARKLPSGLFFLPSTETMVDGQVQPGLIRVVQTDGSRMKAVMVGSDDLVEYLSTKTFLLGVFHRFGKESKVQRKERRERFFSVSAFAVGLAAMDRRKRFHAHLATQAFAMGAMPQLVHMRLAAHRSMRTLALGLGPAAIRERESARRRTFLFTVGMAIHAVRQRAASRKTTLVFVLGAMMVDLRTLGKPKGYRYGQRRPVNRTGPRVRAIFWDELPDVKQTIWTSKPTEVLTLRSLFPDLRSAFTEKVVEKKQAAIGGDNSKPKLKSFLDGKLSHNLSIAASKFKSLPQYPIRSFDIVREGMEAMDTTDMLGNVGLEVVDNCVKLLKEDARAYEKARAIPEHELKEYAMAEQFVYYLAQVPRVVDRVFAMKETASFEDNLALVTRVMTVFEEATAEILTNPKLVEFLVDVVRPFGNELARSSGRKIVQGIKISGLVKLGATRTADNKMTSLFYIVSVLAEKRPYLLELADEFPACGNARKLQFRSIEDVMRDVSTTVKKLTDAVEQARAENDHIFVQRVQYPVEQARARLEETQSRVSKLQADMKRVMDYLGEGSRDASKPEEVLSEWYTFVELLQNTVKEYYQKKAEEERKRREAEIKAERAAAATAAKVSRVTGRQIDPKSVGRASMSKSLAAKAATGLAAGAGR